MSHHHHTLTTFAKHERRIAHVLVALMLCSPSMFQTACTHDPLQARKSTEAVQIKATAADPAGPISSHRRPTYTAAVHPGLRSAAQTTLHIASASRPAPPPAVPMAAPTPCPTCFAIDPAAFKNGERLRSSAGLPPGHIALTFDDGPHRKYTPMVLDILDEYDVKATFFLVGKQALRNKDLVQEIIRRGHSVGTHTYSHAYLTRIPHERAVKEIQRGRAAVLEAAGPLADHVSMLFRFPGGWDHANDALHAVVREEGMVNVFWNMSGSDSKAKRRAKAHMKTRKDAGHMPQPGDYELALRDAVFNQAMANLKSKKRGVLLLHDMHAYTVAALPLILDELTSPNHLAGTAHGLGIERFTLVQLTTPGLPAAQ